MSYFEFFTKRIALASSLESLENVKKALAHWEEVFTTLELCALDGHIVAKYNELRGIE